ncbi:hypothetical protein [Burkholderia cenocepacia]|uniref:hypothetical protein n=1 Tax=Burkholderia cenocepacia TaxID=95486 RepID=UPI001E2E5186|nr:hypothetical protein [Burkholderia cenocepacia]
MLLLATFFTSAPDCSWIVALSATAIAVASPTTTCAFGPIVTCAPDGADGPVPIVEVHGDGALVSHVVATPDVTQFARACGAASASAAVQAMAIRVGWTNGNVVGLTTFFFVRRMVDVVDTSPPRIGSANEFIAAFSSNFGRDGRQKN